MALTALALISLSVQERVSFPTQDGGLVYAEIYGQGPRGVVLAHGGRFNKESWKPQAEVLAAEGYRAIAVDFRGYGKSTGPKDARHFDVLAAARYLRDHGATSVAVVGGSLGAGAAADALIEGPAGLIDRFIGLGGVSGAGPPEKIRGPKLFIVTRDDTSGSGRRLPGMRAAYAKMPGPKRILVLEGSAHAQFMFQEPALADRVMREILQFLSAR